jgi:hypothetical protein
LRLEFGQSSRVEIIVAVFPLQIAACLKSSRRKNALKQGHSLRTRDSGVSAIFLARPLLLKRYDDNVVAGLKPLQSDCKVFLSCLSVGSTRRPRSSRPCRRLLPFSSPVESIRSRASDAWPHQAANSLARALMSSIVGKAKPVEAFCVASR